MTVRIIRRGDANAVLDRIRRGLEGPKTVKVGFPSGSDPEQLEKAVYVEFGTAGGASGGGWGGPVPERPALRNAMRDNRSAYRRFAIAEGRKILAGETALGTTLNRLGLLAVGHMQQSIVDLKDPPNAPITIERKGSSNPLIDTGAYRQSIRHKVEDA